MSESDLFQLKPILSSSLNSKQEFPDDFHSFNVLYTNQLNKQTKSSISQPLLPLPSTPPPPSQLPPPPPPPPPLSLFLSSSNAQLSSKKSPPLSNFLNPDLEKFKPDISSSEIFKNELGKAKNVLTSEKQIIEEKKNSSIKSFDINEIKNFKFKNLENKEIKEQRRPLILQSKNPWDSLMNEIRSNEAVSKLKKVSNSEKKSKHMKFNLDCFDNDSNLVRDLNQILNERSQFFKEDEDENDSTDDDSWNWNKN